MSWVKRKIAWHSVLRYLLLKPFFDLLWHLLKSKTRKLENDGGVEGQRWGCLGFSVVCSVEDPVCSGAGGAPEGSRAWGALPMLYPGEEKVRSPGECSLSGNWQEGKHPALRRPLRAWTLSHSADPTTQRLSVVGQGDNNTCFFLILNLFLLP